MHVDTKNLVRIMFELHRVHGLSERLIKELIKPDAKHDITEKTIRSLSQTNEFLRETIFRSQ